jgi:hypothetical protein
MMLNINLDYDWIMGEGANYKTSILLNGRKHICHSIWAGVSSNDALSSSLLPPTLNGRTTKPLFRENLKFSYFGIIAIFSINILILNLLNQYFKFQASCTKSDMR